MFEVMPVSMEFLRGVVGVLSLLFAYMAGRTLVAFRKGRAKQSALIGWMIRTAVCAFGVIFPQRAVDAQVIVVWALAAATFAAGMWAASRQKKPEDLTRAIFPDEP
jgi:hypothetical protein